MIRCARTNCYRGGNGQKHETDDPERGSGEVAAAVLTRPGTLLRHQIPIRGSVWEENKAGWLEVDTVALCGGSVAGESVWMLDGVDYATAWVEVRV